MPLLTLTDKSWKQNPSRATAVRLAYFSIYWHMPLKCHWMYSKVTFCVSKVSYFSQHNIFYAHFSSFSLEVFRSEK